MKTKEMREIAAIERCLLLGKYKISKSGGNHPRMYKKESWEVGCGIHLTELKKY